MKRHIIIEDNPRAMWFLVAGIIVGYLMCLAIGFSVGVMWPQIVARLG